MSDTYLELVQCKAIKGYGYRKNELLREYRITHGAYCLALIFDPDNRLPDYISSLKEIEEEVRQITRD